MSFVMHNLVRVLLMVHVPRSNVFESTCDFVEVKALGLVELHRAVHLDGRPLARPAGLMSVGRLQDAPIRSAVGSDGRLGS